MSAKTYQPAKKGYALFGSKIFFLFALLLPCKLVLAQSHITQTISKSKMSLSPTPINPAAGMHLMLTNNDAVSTQTGIYFSSAYSDAYNQDEDAVDLDGISPVVYLSSFSSDGVRLGINALGDYIKGKHVRLFVKGTTTGTYQLGIADIFNIDTLFNVLLVDKKLKDSVDLRKIVNYDFNIDIKDTTTFGAYRFELAVDLKPLPPYKLTSFEAEKTDKNIQLTWKTENEGGYTGFTVEKQSGAKFITLDSLQSNGNGSYNYTDIQPEKGTNTYRLKQNGVTGTVTYSSIINIKFGESSTFCVYPNPTRGPINLNLPQSGSYNVSIYNTMGKLMKHLSLSGNSCTEDVTLYASGTYIVKMSDNKGVYIGEAKFIKVQ